MVLTSKLKAKLKDYYFNPSKPGAFSGASALHREIGRTININLPAINEFLAQEWPYALHKPVRRKFTRRRYVTSGLNRQWQADLVEMQPLSRQNKGHRYLLTVIDIFSRYAYARALKDKTGPEVAKALASIIEKDNNGIAPNFLQTDQGKEFYNVHVQKLCNKYNMELFSVYSDNKAAIVERFNRTLKDRMYRYFTYKGTHEWLDVLPKLLHGYNHSYHRSIECAPASINVLNAMKTFKQQYADVKKGDKLKASFHVGDRVRISKLNGVFRRGYLPGWSDELFTVHAIDRKYSPLMYVLRDDSGEILQGKFYKQELQLVPQNSSATGELHRIEKVLKTKHSGASKLAYVKWMGSKTPTWIPFKNIQTIS